MKNYLTKQLTIGQLKGIFLFIFFLSSAITFGQKTDQPSYPFQSPDMPIEQRVSNIVSLMTLDEKVAFLSQSPGVERLGIKKMGHVEGLHGLAQGAPGGWGRRGPVTTTTNRGKWIRKVHGSRSQERRQAVSTECPTWIFIQAT